MNPFPADPDNDFHPPLGEWPGILASNLAPSDPPAHRSRIESWAFIRQAILTAAESYTSTLSSVAEAVGIALPAPKPSLPGRLEEPRRPVVATGHQPVVFHSGILVKNMVLQSLMNHTSSDGLMVSIDTDEGDATRFSYPGRSAAGKLELRTTSFSKGGSLFLSQEIASADQVSSVAEQVSSALNDIGFAAAAEQTKTFLNHYGNLSGRSAVVAQAITRRLWEGSPTYHELPLSMLVGLPEVRQWIEAIVVDGAAVHRSYNATLAQFRRDQHIKNTANPFPDLTTEGGRIELPFWVIDPQRGTRRPMVIDPIHIDPNAQFADSLLVPRGMMITTILRLLASDLFIHGTGGAQYDLCTDQWIASYFELTAPQFVKATTTRFLFDDEMKSIRESENKLDRIKDAAQRFQKAVDGGLFSGAANIAARQLIDYRADAIARLRKAKSQGQSASDINVELKSIDVDIKAFVWQTLGGDETEKRPSADHLAVLQTRTFPMFFLDPPSPDAFSHFTPNASPPTVSA